MPQEAEVQHEENSEIGGSLSETSFDLLESFARNMEAEENSVEELGDADQADDEVGPEVKDTEGELTDETDDSPSEDDESEEDDEEEEQTDSEEDDAEGEDDEQPEAETNPLQDKLDQLEAQFAQSQQQNAQLLLILQQQLDAQQQTAPPSKDSGFSEEEVRVALFGGDDKALEAWSPEKRLKVQEFANNWASRQARLALDPASLYEDIKQLVLADIRNEIQPVKQEFFNRRAKQVMDENLEGIDLKADKVRLRQLYEKQPGSKSADWSDQKRAFEHAAAELKLEKREQALAEKERRATSRKRQEDVNKKARRGKGRRGKVRPRPKKPDLPSFQGDLAKLYEQIKEQDVDPAE